jgi:hypothetical protein
LLYPRHYNNKRTHRPSSLERGSERASERAIDLPAHARATT